MLDKKMLNAVETAIEKREINIKECDLLHIINEVVQWNDTLNDIYYDDLENIDDNVNLKPSEWIQLITNSPNDISWYDDYYRISPDWYIETITTRRYLQLLEDNASIILTAFISDNDIWESLFTEELISYTHNVVMSIDNWTMLEKIKKSF